MKIYYKCIDPEDCSSNDIKYFNYYFVDTSSYIKHNVVNFRQSEKSHHFYLIVPSYFVPTEYECGSFEDYVIFMMSELNNHGEPGIIEDFTKIDGYVNNKEILVHDYYSVEKFETVVNELKQIIPRCL